MSPAQAQAALQQALQHHNAGRLTQARTAYSQIRAANPQHFDAHHLGGAAALQDNAPEEALALLTKAVRLRPSSSATLMCLALAHARLGQTSEAEKTLRSALKFDPKNFEAWSNLGSLLVLRNQLQEAADAYQQAVRINPKFAQGWTGLGSVQQLQQKPAEALENHTRALRLDPRHPKAQFARAQSLQSLHRVEEALADLQAHLLRQPADLEAASARLYLLNYSAETAPAQLFAEHRAFGAKLKAGSRTGVRSRLPDTFLSPRRLRVAFLSPDLRTHAVAHFIEPLLEHLDREKFEIFLYHDHFSVDEVSARLKRHASLWRNFIGASHQAVETQIRADQVDVLFDLAGHTGMNRLDVFARRVAPVQITYLGYPNTTGVEAMDYRFTDEQADPTGPAEALHTERLVRFSSCAWAYRPPEYATPPALAPFALGQPFTFGSFNNLSKVNRRTLSLWAKLLHATPGARLLLKSFGCDAAEMRKRAGDAGIPVERLLIAPHNASPGEHLAMYGKVDVALDPDPYNGTTTTCEALWMGVPVVTLRGGRHASRVGSSLLAAINRTEWIAEDDEAYIAKAHALAASPEGLGRIRESLRKEVLASALLDHTGQAKRFGEAILHCWRNLHEQTRSG